MGIKIDDVGKEKEGNENNKQKEKKKGIDKHFT